MKYKVYEKSTGKIYVPSGFDETFVVQPSGIVGKFNGRTYDTVTDDVIIMPLLGKLGEMVYDVIFGKDYGLEIFEYDVLAYKFYDAYEDIEKDMYGVARCINGKTYLTKFSKKYKGKTVHADDYSFKLLIGDEKISQIRPIGSLFEKRIWKQLNIAGVKI